MVNYRSSALLEDNLRWTHASETPPMVVVVDNYSDDHELASIRALAERSGWVLVESVSNLGFGAAANIGAGAAFRAGADAILLLNPDASVEPCVAAELVDACRSGDGAIVTPTIVDTRGKLSFVGSEVSMRTGRIRGLSPVVEHPDGTIGLGSSRLDEPRVRWATAACMAIPRRVFEALDGFDTDYFMYWEDVDLSARALWLGIEVVVRPDLVAVHDEGGTQERRFPAKSLLYYRYNTRNRLLFASRHLPRRDRWRWILTTPAVSWEILLRGGRRQIVQSPRTLLSAIAGSCCGVGLVLRSLVVDARSGGGR